MIQNIILDLFSLSKILQDSQSFFGSRTAANKWEGSYLDNRGFLVVPLVLFLLNWY